MKLRYCNVRKVKKTKVKEFKFKGDERELRKRGVKEERKDGGMEEG